MILPAYSGTLSLLLSLLLLGVGLVGKRRRLKRDFPLWMIIGIIVGIVVLVMNLHWAHLI